MRMEKTEAIALEDGMTDDDILMTSLGMNPGTWG